MGLISGNKIVGNQHRLPNLVSRSSTCSSVASFEENQVVPIYLKTLCGLSLLGFIEGLVCGVSDFVAIVLLVYYSFHLIWEEAARSCKVGSR